MLKKNPAEEEGQLISSRALSEKEFLQNPFPQQTV
jgi:hypothetical protein